LESRNSDVIDNTHHRFHNNGMNAVYFFEEPSLTAMTFSAFVADFLLLFDNNTQRNGDAYRDANSGYVDTSHAGCS